MRRSMIRIFNYPPPPEIWTFWRLVRSVSLPPRAKLCSNALPKFWIWWSTFVTEIPRIFLIRLLLTLYIFFVKLTDNSYRLAELVFPYSEMSAVSSPQNSVGRPAERVFAPSTLAYLWGEVKIDDCHLKPVSPRSKKFSSWVPRFQNEGYKYFITSSQFLHSLNVNSSVLQLKIG